MANVKVENLIKIYPSGETALNDINFEADDGEFLVVVGGEGSGKSSLLRAVAGLDEVTAGKIVIGGKDVTGEHPKDRNIAMVFRHDTLYPDRTIFENLAFGLKQRKASQAVINARVNAAAALLGLTDVLQKKPKALTSAARQRVAIGRAVAREPKVYLFDEPLAGLDEKLSADMLNLIVNLQARLDGTFIYATKNLSEAMTIGTRIVVLKNGLVQQIDTPANLYDYPANAYTAFYIGSPTINFIKGATVERDADGAFVVFEGGKIKLSESVISRFEKLEHYVVTGDKIWLGIRPEDCVFGGDGDAECRIKKVENDGDRSFAEIEVFGGISMIVGGQSNLEVDKIGKVKFDLTKLQIFDEVTRLTLLSRDEGYIKTNKKDAEFTPKSFVDEEKPTKNKPEKKK